MASCSMAMRTMVRAQFLGKGLHGKESNKHEVVKSKVVWSSQKMIGQNQKIVVKPSNGNAKVMVSFSLSSLRLPVSTFSH
jgi:hypothetical protein